jgi:flagellar hook-associated protein 2
MASSITAPVTVSQPGFTGTSKFASSLQSVLTRAVGIASLPLNSLQAGLTTLNGKQNALQGLDTYFSSLQASLGSLEGAVSSGLLNTSVSDGNVISASVQAGASPGQYSIEVQSLGAFSTALSNAGSSPVTDVTTQGITTSSSVTLQLGAGTPVTITPASSSLKDLASAINSQASDKVQATVVNVGSTSAPDYRLSVQAIALGTDSISLTDSSGTNLIASSNAGQLASYKVDGTTAITSTSRTVTLSNGLTVQLLGQSTAGQAATVTVSNSANNVASAFSSFATAYNSAVDAVTQNRGQNGGALQGDTVLESLGSVLSQLGTFSNGTPNTALANFGISLDQTGHLSVDTNALTTAANADFPTFLSTLGNSTTGGFLKAASNLLDSVENATTGALKGEETLTSTQIASQNTKITNAQATVTQLQTNLTAQIAQADATIAGLESQVSYVTGLFATFTGANSTQSNGLSTL